MPCDRDMGIVELVLTKLLPEFYNVHLGGAAPGLRALERISERVRTLTAQIPGIETVRGILLPKGSKTGPQFRACMHVMDIAVCDQPAIVREAVNALTAWYWHVKKKVFADEDVIQFDVLRNILWGKLTSFLPYGCSFSTPKVFGCSIIAEVARRYGPPEYVSTDAYERSHKALKAVYERSVLLHLHRQR